MIFCVCNPRLRKFKPKTVDLFLFAVYNAEKSKGGKKMTLSEKICYCRKKAGISQEVLASRLGVSRQAVSKWETGEAEPELSKIKALASEFDVSLDWLLSDADPREEKATYEYNEGGSTSSAGWIKSVPGFLGSLFRKYGWLGGVYFAVSGLATAFIGWLARFISNKMLNSFGGSWFASGFGGTQIFNPVAVLGSVIMGIGGIIFIAGVVFTVVFLAKKEK